MDPHTSRWQSADPAGFDLANPMKKNNKGEIVPKENFSIIESTNWYTYCSNNPLRYTDPTGLYLTDGGSKAINAIVNKMYSNSKTFQTAIDAYGKSTSMVLQFSNMELEGEYTMANTNPRMEIIPEGSITAKTLNADGKWDDATIKAGTELPVVFINIDLDKCIEGAEELGISAEEYITFVISNEIGHANDVLELGFEGFWEQVKKETEMDYTERPSEKNADSVSDQIMNELEK